MHGDFLAEVEGAEGNLMGGLALLSGYLNKVRSEARKVLYVIAGDMVRGSMIDMRLNSAQKRRRFLDILEPPHAVTLSVDRNQRRLEWLLLALIADGSLGNRCQGVPMVIHWLGKTSMAARGNVFRSSSGRRASYSGPFQGCGVYWIDR